MTKTFQFVGHTLDVARSLLQAADREVQLRPKSFDVLVYLVENADRLVPKEELINAIWPNVVVTDELLTHCVSELRNALGDSAPNHYQDGAAARLPVRCSGLAIGSKSGASWRRGGAAQLCPISIESRSRRCQTAPPSRSCRSRT